MSKYSSNFDLQPRIPITAWGLVIRAVIAVVVLLTANSIRIPISSWLINPQNAQTGDTPDQVLLSSLIFLLTPVVIFAFLALWMPLVERRGLKTISFPYWRGILPGLVGGTVAVAVPVAIAWPLAMALAEPLDNSPAQDSDIGGTLIGAYVVYFLVRSFLLQGIPEEFLFRGWLFSTTKSKPIFSLVWTALAFTVIHLTSSGGQQSTKDFILYLVMPLGMGAIAGAVVLWTENTWWAAGTHGGFHILLTVLSMLFPFSMGSSTWVVLGIMQVLAAVVMTFAWLRRRN